MVMKMRNVLMKEWIPVTLGKKESREITQEDRKNYHSDNENEDTDSVEEDIESKLSAKGEIKEIPARYESDLDE